jgi:hypothetical protein
MGNIYIVPLDYGNLQIRKNIFDNLLILMSFLIKLGKCPCVAMRKNITTIAYV